MPWAPLVANPAYSDYTSGHGSATSPFAQVLRRTLGDHTTLVLKAGALTRTYTSLRALEHDALNARIWGGLPIAGYLFRLSWRWALRLTGRRA